MLPQWRLNNDNSLLIIKTILSEFSRLTKEPFLKKKTENHEEKFLIHAYQVWIKDLYFKLPNPINLIQKCNIFELKKETTNIFIFIFIFSSSFNKYFPKLFLCTDASFQCH